MKTMIAKMTMVTFAAAALANCQERTARFAVRVQDDAGKPVSGCEVVGSFFDHWKAGEGFGEDIFKKTRVLAGPDGTAVINGSTTRSDIYYSVTTPEGYYRTARAKLTVTGESAGKWQPYDQKVTIVLKRKLKPIPMFARKFGMGMKSNADIPGLGKEFGFDLMVSDWMPPHGQGKTADIFFTLTQQYTDPRNFDAKLKVRFPGVGNGLIRVPRAPREGSVLRLGHNAPENEYQDAFEYRTAALPPYNIIKSDVKEDMNYYMRIRAVTEASGRIASCNYGKIHGDFRFDVTNSRRIYFEYYLNPSPNDRNIEFDTKNNLFKSLSSGEEVNEP